MFFSHQLTHRSRIAAASLLLAVAVFQISAAGSASGNEASKPTDAMPWPQEKILELEGMAAFLAIPANHMLQTEWQQQYADLEADIANREYFQSVADETYCEASLILPTDRDPLDVVLRRTAALLDDLRQLDRSADFTELASRLRTLEAASRTIDVDRSETRRVLFADACRLRREIALRNPLLDFSDILFIKHHRALFNHMCDQYYGMAATPGGGLFVLANAFGHAGSRR